MTDIKTMLEKAKAVSMTPEQREAQRRSFAFGNANIENERITRETVDQAAETLNAKRGG
jgi:hypothetical protein